MPAALKSLPYVVPEEATDVVSELLAELKQANADLDAAKVAAADKLTIVKLCEHAREQVVRALVEAGE